MRATCYGMGVAMTFGIGELYAFPCEVYRLCTRTMLGQKVRFTYDREGNVKKVFIDDDELSFMTNRSRQVSASENQGKPTIQSPVAIR